MTSVTVEVAVGELVDKITILEIKSERLIDPAALANVRAELEVLRAARDAQVPRGDEIDGLTRELKTVNETLWEIEDQIRLKESRLEFDQEFIKLARSVYLTNDERAAVTREINVKVGSDLVGEKSYTEY